MTAIDGQIAFSGLSPRKARAIDFTAMTEDELAVLRNVNGRSGPLTTDERNAALARQNAVEAHTVYRMGGEILGVQWRDGVTTFTENAADGGASLRAKEQARTRGLTGDAANDLIAGEIAAALTERYGLTVQVKSYISGAGPSRGDLQSEMFGRGSASAVSAPRSRVSVDSRTFAVLQETE